MRIHFPYLIVAIILYGEPQFFNFNTMGRVSIDVRAVLTLGIGIGIFVIGFVSGDITRTVDPADGLLDFSIGYFTIAGIVLMIAGYVWSLISMKKEKA